MTNRIQIRRGLAANRTSITPASGELLYTTDTKQVFVGDGSTAGGVSVGTNGSLLRVSIFTSSGTWTKGTGTTRVLAYGVGGGGGAFAAATNNAAAGGSAGFCQEFIDVSAVSNVSVTVGAGGTAVTTGTAGTGGASSFGSYWTANGGTGASDTTLGVGGTATGGDINIDGNSSIGNNNTFLGTPSFFGSHPAFGSSANARRALSAALNGASGIVIVEEYA